MRRPFDTSRAGSGFLHGSRFARGILNPRSKRAERSETVAAADMPDTTATGKGGSAQADTPGREEASPAKAGKTPDETTEHCFA